MSYKKLSLAASALCVLALCCGFSLTPKKAAPAPAKLKVAQSWLSDPPVQILSALADADGLTVEVLNKSAAAVEFVQFRAGRNRVSIGQNTITTEAAKINVPAFRLESDKATTLKFSAVRTVGLKNYNGEIQVYAVLLSDGTGWLDGLPLKRLVKPDKKGFQWNIDVEESKRWMQTRSGVRSGPVAGASSFIAKKQPSCWRITGGLITEYCSIGTCSVFYPAYQQVYPPEFGVQVDFFTHTDCYQSGGEVCGSTNYPLIVGSCE